MTRYGLHGWFPRARDGRTSGEDPTRAWDTLQMEECGPSRAEAAVAVDDGPFPVQRQTWYGYGEEPGATLTTEWRGPPYIDQIDQDLNELGRRGVDVGMRSTEIRRHCWSIDFRPGSDGCGSLLSPTDRDVEARAAELRVPASTSCRCDRQCWVDWCRGVGVKDFSTETSADVAAAAEEEDGGAGISNERPGRVANRVAVDESALIGSREGRGRATR